MSSPLCIIASIGSYIYVFLTTSAGLVDYTWVFLFYWMQWLDVQPGTFFVCCIQRLDVQ